MMEPVAQQWAVFENGNQKTSWTPAGYGDEAGWVEVAKKYDFFTVAYRPLVRLSDAEARIAELENELVLMKAVAGGTGSLLLDVQRDCIAAVKRANAAEALLKEAGKALEPFSQCEIDENCPDTRQINAWQARPNYGDIRAARAIHDKIGGKDE